MNKLTPTGLVAALAALALTQFASAQSTWTGGNTTNDWNVAGNWSPSGVPNGVGLRAVFTSISSTSWTNSTNTLGSLFVSGGNLTIGNNSISSDVLRLETSSGTPVISNATDVFFYANLEGNQGFEKTGAGRFTFRFNGDAQNYTGNILISQGILGINQDSSLGDSNNDITIAGGARLLAEPGSNSGTITLGSLRTITLAGAQSQLGSGNAAVNMVIEGDVLETGASNGLVKTDAGVVTLSGNLDYSGETRIAGGTLRLTNSAALPTGQNLRFNQNAAATLDVTDTSQTVRTIVMDVTTANRTITGSGGSFTVNGDANLQLSANNGVTYNFAGLNAFTFNRTNRNFNFQTINVAGVTAIADLNLAKGGVGGGTNTISAAAILVGGANSDGNNGNTARLHLGANNTFNAATLTLGGFNAGGIIDFQTGLSSSNLTLRGANGTAAMTTLTIGETSSGSRRGEGVLNLGSGSLDALVTDIRLGRHIANASIADTSSMTIGAGNLTASTLVMATKTGGGTPTVSSTFNQNGGTVAISSITLGDGAGTEAAILLPTYNLNGGSLAAATIGAGAGASYNTTSTARTLGVNGGTLRNASGQDLTVNGLNTTASGRINVVIGASGGTIEADAARNVSVGANALISGAGALTKAGNGTLTINSASTHTGATTINAGLIALGASAAISTNTLIFGGTSGTLDVGGNNQTVRTISITNASGANTVTGTGGSLAINGDANQEFLLGSGGALDFSSLDAFTFNRTNRQFKFEMVNVSGVALANINLAAGGVGGGTNTIAASFILVGGGNSAGDDGNTARLHLGTANTFNATSFRVGGFNAAGLVDFQSGLTGSSLTLRGTDGVGAMTTWIIGETSSGTRNGSGVVDLTGGSLDALVTDMTIGRHVPGANISDTSTFTMSSGSLTATTLLMAEKLATGAPTITSTFNQLGGDVTVSTVTLGSDAGAGATARLLPTINIDGGTFKATTVQIGGGAFAANSARTLNIGTATLQNAAGTDLTISSANSSAGGRINVGLTGAATFAVDADRTINVGANTLLTGSGSLTKTGAGTLILSSGIASANTGALNINNGVVNLAGSGVASTGTISSVAVATNAILLISQSNQVNNSTTTVSLSGGTITRASGVSEVFGALSLDFDSVLDFGSGTSGNMRFGVYEGGATPSALLTVNNFFGGNTLTFGTDLSGYIDASYNGTAFTSDYFNINSTSGGFTSSWNSGTSTFTITAIPEPSTYLAAAALLGLMLWPSRRRLLKDAKSILGLRAPMRDRLARR